MTNLYTVLTSQSAPDIARSTDVGVLTYVAVNLFTQPSYQAVYDIGASNNSSATPFPIFINDADARVYFDPIAASTILPLANAQTTLTTYSALDIETVTMPVLMDLNSLATVAKTGSYTDLTNTPAIPAAQVNTDWNAVSGITQLVNKPSLATVATSGSYSDLTGKPSIPAAQVNSDWNSVSGLSQILNKPSLATVATSGAYSDLTGKPSLATVATSGSYNDLSNKPTIPTVQAYEGVNARANAFPFFGDATVASGVAVFQLTTNGISTGTAIFPNGVIADSVNVFVSDATASYQMSVAFSNGNKTITVTTNKLTTANILTGLLGQTAANGAVVKLQIYGY